MFFFWFRSDIHLFNSVFYTDGLGHGILSRNAPVYNAFSVALFWLLVLQSGQNTTQWNIQLVVSPWGINCFKWETLPPPCPEHFIQIQVGEIFFHTYYTSPRFSESLRWFPAYFRNGIFCKKVTPQNYHQKILLKIPPKCVPRGNDFSTKRWPLRTHWCGVSWGSEMVRNWWKVVQKWGPIWVFPKIGVGPANHEF